DDGRIVVERPREGHHARVDGHRAGERRAVSGTIAPLELPTIPAWWTTPSRSAGAMAAFLRATIRARRAVGLAICAGAVMLAIGCGLIHDSSTTGPTSPTATEKFSGTLTQNGSGIFYFTTTHAGAVSVTLVSTTPTVSVGLTLGTATLSSGSSASN